MAKKFICEQCGQTFEAASKPDKCPICGADSSKIKEVKSKGINTNSNVYTICYAAVMVIIVAFLLAFVASALKETQDANVANDTKGQILSALGYDKATVDVGAIYAEKVKDNVLENGELTPYEGKFNTSYGALIKNGELHVFTGTTANGEKAYVIPVVGRGLWGGLWGYIAVNEAKDKVLGTYFYHESETAGLGARISEKWFQDQFIGKPIFGEDGKVALTVVKAGAAQQENEVDGVTGATLTSNGVAAMVKDGLTAYTDFLGATGECPNKEKCQGTCPNETGCQGCKEECEKTNVEQ
jgi:Na+-transporting NADH:ubiquinone oxidoreductase subunit C